MQDFINDLKKVISAPLLIVSHDIFKYAIHLLDNVHLHQLSQLNLPRLDNGPDDLDGESIKFGVVNLEVLENYFYQLKFVKDHYECRISLYHYG